MKNKSTSLLKGFYHIKIAQEYFEDFLREYPESRADKMLKNYIKKLKWIETDFRTCPAIPIHISEEMRKEMKGDLLFPTAIAEKCLFLPEKNREAIEYIIDKLLEGEVLEINEIDKDA